MKRKLTQVNHLYVVASASSKPLHSWDRNNSCQDVSFSPLQRQVAVKVNHPWHVFWDVPQTASFRRSYYAHNMTGVTQFNLVNVVVICGWLESGLSGTSGLNGILYLAIKYGYIFISNDLLCEVVTHPFRNFKGYFIYTCFCCTLSYLIMTYFFGDLPNLKKISVAVRGTRN